MNNVAVVDYNAGNTMSVMKALDYLGMKVILTNDKETLLNSDRVILPGVGAFHDALENLEKNGLTSVIKEICNEKDIPFLGICLGMQLLFDESEETIGGKEDEGPIKGLGIFKGDIVRFEPSINLKIPHVGWNSLKVSKDSRLFHGIENDPYVYFVHSYYLRCADKAIVSSTCEYGHAFDASVERGNKFACQFHPEKSGDTGLRLLKNFCEMKGTVC